MSERLGPERGSELERAAGAADHAAVGAGAVHQHRAARDGGRAGKAGGQGFELQPAGSVVPSKGSSRVRASSTVPAARTTLSLTVPCENSAAVSSTAVTVAALAVAAPTGPTAAATSAAVTILRVLELLSMTTLPCRSRCPCRRLTVASGAEAPAGARPSGP